ncbi:MAG: protease SohB [bacterium]
MSYLFEYLGFLAQVVTIVIAIIVIISAIVNASSRATQGDGQGGYLRVTKLNNRLRELRHAMEGQLLPPDAAKKQHKLEAKAESAALKEQQKAQIQALKSQHKAAKKTVEPASTEAPSTDGDDAASGKVFVLQFDGDVSASEVEHLRTEVSAVLTMATTSDEVVVCIESPGGMVHSYGFAASQLSRVRARNIPLTVVVDRVAASGGYLMAAVANKIVAAPFALIGSIGVVAQIPNVHRLLKKNDVDVEILTAGKYKRTMTTLGENTEEGREKFIAELEDVHALFQEFVVGNRPDLNIEAVATGEAWYGTRAINLGLVDQLATSDEYVMSCCEDREVYQIQWVEHKKALDKILGKVNTLVDNVAQLFAPNRH